MTQPVTGLSSNCSANPLARTAVGFALAQSRCSGSKAESYSLVMAEWPDLVESTGYSVPLTGCSAESTDCSVESTAQAALFGSKSKIEEPIATALMESSRSSWSSSLWLSSWSVATSVAAQSADNAAADTRCAAADTGSVGIGLEHQCCSAACRPRWSRQQARSRIEDSNDPAPSHGRCLPPAEGFRPDYIPDATCRLNPVLRCNAAAGPLCRW